VGFSVPDSNSCSDPGSEFGEVISSADIIGITVTSGWVCSPGSPRCKRGLDQKPARKRQSDKQGDRIRLE